MIYSKEKSLQLAIEGKTCNTDNDCFKCYFHMHYTNSYTHCYLVRFFHLNCHNNLIDVINRKKIKKIKEILN